MKFVATLAVSLIVSSPAFAQTAARYDLDCKHKSAFILMGGQQRDVVSPPVRISIDLNAKLWCARNDDMSCGKTSPLLANATVLTLNEALSIDRRTGVMTRTTERSRYSGVAEYTCKKVGFTPLPTIKF